MEDTMFKPNKALLSILILSGLTVQTTQPVDWSWLTNNSIYKQGSKLCSNFSETDVYKKGAPYGNLLLKEANKNKGLLQYIGLVSIIANGMDTVKEVDGRYSAPNLKQILSMRTLQDAALMSIIPLALNMLLKKHQSKNLEAISSIANIAGFSIVGLTIGSSHMPNRQTILNAEATRQIITVGLLLLDTVTHR